MYIREFVVQDTLLPYEKRTVELTFAPTFIPSGRGWDHFQTTPTRRDYSLYLRIIAVNANRDSKCMIVQIYVCMYNETTLVKSCENQGFLSPLFLLHSSFPLSSFIPPLSLPSLPPLSPLLQPVPLIWRWLCVHVLCLWMCHWSPALLCSLEPAPLCTPLHSSSRYMYMYTYVHVHVHVHASIIIDTCMHKYIHIQAIFRLDFNVVVKNCLIAMYM